jgi:tRNA (cmo5U34)-methyltransferase
MTTGPAKNPWLDDSDMEFTGFYTDNADLFMVERRRLTKLLVDIFGYHFADRKGLALLDLGCGDGHLTKNIIARHPGHSFTLTDGSKHMIEKARAGLTGARAAFRHESFERYIATTADFSVYDFVYSGFAIHHLDFHDKNKLYSAVFKALTSGGLFLNIDVVAPVSDRSDGWWIRMWKDWMTETVTGTGIRDQARKLAEFHRIAEEKTPDDMPSGLEDQLMELRRIGFRDVDCFYKYGSFALFGGTKPA